MALDYEAIGQSDAFLRFQEQLSCVARVDRPVLILGERGTGKELAASRLHYLSTRWEAPLVALNCAALSSSLIESELFGYEEGAFTGARRARAGRFETAEGGTLFLDELGNLPVTVQEKILRVVEYGSFERVGSSVPTETDVRLVGATNADLPALAGEGRFMRDLLDRLSFEVLHLPPLRERTGDIMLLAAHFAARMAHEMGREEPPDFSDEAVRRLEGYPWPGNIRELKNVVERAVYRSGGGTVDSVVFDPFRARRGAPSPKKEPDTEEAPPASPPSSAAPSTGSFSERVRALEIALLRSALEDERYHQRRAAERLGLSYHQFRRLYRKYRDALENSPPPAAP